MSTSDELLHGFSDTVRSVEEILGDLGYLSGDSYDDNFTMTPERWATWLYGFAKVDTEKAVREILTPVFSDSHQELVVVQNISYMALCAHHVLPFTGRAHVGYVPSGNGVVGISKIARAVKIVAHQLTLQERITRILADGIYKTLDCQGVMVVLTDTTHGCMSIRGVADDHITTTTSAVRGIFATNKDGVKDEFLSLIGRG